MKRGLSILMGMALALAIGTPAQAAGRRASHDGGSQPKNPGTVTLLAAPSTVTFGQTVALTGTIAPTAAAEYIIVKTTQGDTVAEADTDGAGAYAASFAPDHNVTIHAEWGSDASAPLDIGVHAVVGVQLAKLQLFEDAKITGTVSPAVAGGTVAVKLLDGTKTAGSAQAKMDASGAFSAQIPVNQEGSYKAQASFSDATHLEGTATSEEQKIKLQGLHKGSRGPEVEALEKRLAELGYHLTGINENYDARTEDAVMAFRKVQGMPRRDNVDSAVWRALSDPKVPQPRVKTKKRHIEVDQSRQVLFIVDKGEVTSILHVSTGKPSTPTPNGTFHVYRKVNGYNGLWWPSYIHNGVAIHGWPDVPTYNASHGCVRVPIWSAKWIFGIANMHMRVSIYQ